MPAQFFNAPNMAGYAPGGAGPVPARGPYAAPTVAGGLPFTTAAPPVPTNAAQLGAAYQTAYGQAAQFNKSNYENILAGYQSTIAAQNAGYQNLYADVMGTIAGMERGRAQGIQDSAVAEIGGATQSLIDRGLGNTTVQQSVVSGVNANRDRRLTELAGEMAGIRGGYMSQIGQAQLQSVGALQGAQLDWMNSVSAPYPDAGLYAQLAAQYGAAGAANDAARQIRDAGAPTGVPGSPGGGRLGYVPRPAPGAGPAGAQVMPAGAGGYSIMAGPAPVAAPSVPSWAYGNAIGMTGDAVTGPAAIHSVGGSLGGYGNAIGTTAATVAAPAPAQPTTGYGLGMFGIGRETSPGPLNDWF